MLKIQCEFQIHFVHKYIYFMPGSLHTQISYVQLPAYVMWDLNQDFVLCGILLYTQSAALSSKYILPGKFTGGGKWNIVFFMCFRLLHWFVNFILFF